jgi:Zn-dependent protease with chaperone function
LPNGVVVVYSAMLRTLENEAQLAAVLGHEIAHATQKHCLRQRPYRNEQIAVNVASIFVPFGFVFRDVNTAIVNGYSRALENQADRVGLSYMLAAGYDPREAPRAWAVLAKKLHDWPQPLHVFWSDHDSLNTRRSYLMAELRNNYSDVNFSALETGRERYQKIAAQVKAETLHSN